MASVESRRTAASVPGAARARESGRRARSPAIAFGDDAAIGHRHGGETVADRENDAECHFHQQERNEGDSQNRPACVDESEHPFQAADFAHSGLDGGTSYRRQITRGARSANLPMKASVNQSGFALLQGRSKDTTAHSVPASDVAPSLAGATARRQNDVRCIDVSRTARKPSCHRRRSLRPTSRPWPTCGSGLGGFPWIGSGSTRAGTATEKDVIEAEERENRLCELVDGTLVEKAVGFEESRVAVPTRFT